MNTSLRTDSINSLEYFLNLAVAEGYAPTELKDVVGGIARATRTVAEAVNRAAVTALLGSHGSTNVQGEEVQKLDIFADEVFVSQLKKVPWVHSMISEEREDVIAGASASAASKFVVAFDPLDGSSNIDVNVSIGSIWGVYRKNEAVNGDAAAHYFQAGNGLVAAGYSIYGSSTMLVLSIGAGVSGFTLDHSSGQFVLTHPAMRVPEGGKIYSCNEGNSGRWSAGVRKYIEFCKSAGEGEGAGEDRRPYSHRYVGSLVADFHRTMLKGGIFLYPADKKNTSGKLRLLYECAPLSFLAEQAGGKSTNGKLPILSLVPSALHERSPLFIGSAAMINQLSEFLAEE